MYWEGWGGEVSNLCNKTCEGNVQTFEIPLNFAKPFMGHRKQTCSRLYEQKSNPKTTLLMTLRLWHFGEMTSAPPPNLMLSYNIYVDYEIRIHVSELSCFPSSLHSSTWYKLCSAVRSLCGIGLTGLWTWRNGMKLLRSSSPAQGKQRYSLSAWRLVELVWTWVKHCDALSKWRCLLMF